MSELAYEVHWEEEPERKRKVTGFCENCQRSVSQGNHTRRMSSLTDIQIVAPSGLAHAGHWEFTDKTACGLDATGPEWWWRA